MMGLDTYAYVKVDNKPLPDELFKDVPNILVGGMLSGNGACSSFRGKYYAEFIHRYCDVSLYQETMSEDSLDKIILCLETLVKTLNGVPYNERKAMLKPRGPFINETSPEEVEALLKWFKVVKEHAGIVAGWW